MQIHPNAWIAIFNFMIKYVEVGLEPTIRALRSVLALKVDSSSKSVVNASYRSNALAPLISKSLHKFSDSFFLYSPRD